MLSCVTESRTKEQVQREQVQREQVQRERVQREPVQSEPVTRGGGKEWQSCCLPDFWFYLGCITRAGVSVGVV